MLKKILIFILVILLIAGGVYYWYLERDVPIVLTGTPTPSPLSFNPLNRSNTATPTPIVRQSTTTEETPAVAPAVKAPVLRHLSTTPIGGFNASSTATASVAYYVDRGVGHVFEAVSDESAINKISNTTIPKIYESYWNKNLTSAVLRYIKEETGAIVNFYAEIRPIKNSSSTDASDFIPYEIKGKFMSPDIKEIAVSPKRDRIFTLNVESGRGVGYVSGFDESKKTKIFDTPLTQVALDWPEENTLAITTKPSGVSSGFLYLFDIKKASLTKALGGITGLIAKMSPDGKKILFSSSTSGRVSMNLYITKDRTTQEVVFRTLADKCVWSKLHTDEVYCAVPTEIVLGVYPDDWYKGNVSFVDQIWHLDTVTGEVHLIANPLNLANDLIDAVDLTLDPKENYLYFTNKRDLTLWSLDLNQ